MHSIVSRCLQRQAYPREHKKQRQATSVAEGARRIDVTLRGEMLDDFATVSRYIEGLNRFAAEHNLPGWPIQLSDTEIIRMALSHAATAMREEDPRAAKAGLRRWSLNKATVAPR